MKRSLCLILGDQLNLTMSSLLGFDPQKDLIVMSEVREDVTYVKYHKKKIVFIFSAMRHFAEDLKQRGYPVKYTKLNDRNNTGSIFEEVERIRKIYEFDKIIVTEPSEYRVLEDIKKWKSKFSIPIEIRSDNRFLCSHEEFVTWAEGRKQLRMEYFYRDMRKKYQILMSDGKPEGGEWNYDIKNRKPFKKKFNIPRTYTSNPDAITCDVINLVSEHFPDHFGQLQQFHFGVTRCQALEALDKFIQQRLVNFGDYQDAMLQDEPWMFHSHLSFYLNCGLLLPLECAKRAEESYQKGKAPLNAVEGFIRQVIGWREYVRGVYWFEMPGYESRNFFNAQRKLPDFFWSGVTKMNCLKQCVKETQKNAYAHHIQRLMVLGNFSLIAGLDPKEVNNWYLIVYADAYQWVELPNVTGMVLFADGGILGSKPYAASGAYINKMSDYCKGCHFNVNKKNGSNACPFNYLYWDFLIRNKDKLSDNHRLVMMYKTLERMSDEKIQTIKDDSNHFFGMLDNAQNS